VTLADGRLGLALKPFENDLGLDAGSHCTDEFRGPPFNAKLLGALFAPGKYRQMVGGM